MRYRALLAAGTAAAATLALGSTPVSAGVAPPIGVDPTSGSAGTEVTISGEDCLDGATPGDVQITLSHGEDAPKSFTAAADATGAWTTSLLVEETDPVGTHEVDATCYDDIVEETSELGTVLVNYASASFEVTEAEAPAVLPLSVDPTSGPVGTTVNVSGSDCPNAEVEWALLAGTGLHDAHAIVDVWGSPTGEDGTWSGELFVYDTMFELPDDPEGDLVEVDTVPGADYFVVAFCITDDGSFIESDVVPFDITAGGTTKPRTDTPEVPDVIDVTPQAQPATPVVGDPTYTG